MQIAMWQCVVGSGAGRGGSNVFYTTASERTARARTYSRIYVYASAHAKKKPANTSRVEKHNYYYCRASRERVQRESVRLRSRTRRFRLGRVARFRHPVDWPRRSQVHVVRTIAIPIQKFQSARRKTRTAFQRAPRKKILAEDKNFYKSQTKNHGWNDFIIFGLLETKTNSGHEPARRNGLGNGPEKSGVARRYPFSEIVASLYRYRCKIT